jgi:hypothetical protein
MRTLVALASLLISTTLTSISSAQTAPPQQPLTAPPQQPLTAPPPPMAMPGPAAPAAPAPAAPMPAPAVQNVPSLPPPPVYQEPPAKPSPSFYAVPRAFVLTVGWSYTPTNSLPVATQVTAVTPMGAVVDAGAMWQVRGFDGIRWPAWIGFMSGFLYYGGQTGVSDTYGLNYGIYVKHALFAGRRARLFAGYGLGATQVWIRGLDGRGAGHYTRLSVGVDTHIKRWLHFTTEFSYRFYNLPTFKLTETDNGGYDFHALSLLAGFWFGR